MYKPILPHPTILPQPILPNIYLIGKMIKVNYNYVRCVVKANVL